MAESVATRTRVDEHVEAEISTAACCEMITGAYWDTPDGLIRCPEPPVRCDRPAEWIVRMICHCGGKPIELLCTGHVQATGISYQCQECGCYDRFVHRTVEPLR